MMLYRHQLEGSVDRQTGTDSQLLYEWNRVRILATYKSLKLSAETMSEALA